MSIGKKLYELRKQKGLSQEEVADKLNVSRQTVSKWETDQSMPDFDKIVPICELYSITTDELLLGSKKEETKISEESTNKEEVSVNKRKRAFGISFSVFFYFLAVVWITIAIPVFRMNPILASGIFLLICGVATFIIIYTCMVYKAPKEKKEEDPTKKLVRQVNDIIAMVFVVIYLAVSFITMAWHITWILWCVYACIEEIVKLIFMLRSDKNEK